MAFQDLPIRCKVIAVIMLTSITALLITAAAFMVYDAISYRAVMAHDLSIISSIIADNSSGVLAFPNEPEAEAILTRLRAEPHIVAAALFAENGKIFVHYPTNVSAAEFPLAPKKTGPPVFQTGYLSVFQPVMQGGDQVGTVYLKSDLKALGERLRLYAGIALLVLLGSALVAFVLSNAFQRRISAPVLALTNTAKAISEQRDYSVRAPKVSDDELGLLTNAFNEMLTRIQEQTVALREGEERLRLALEASHTGTWHWDLKTNKMTWDRPWDERALAPFGQKAGVFGADFDDFMKLIDPQDRLNLSQTIKQALQEKTPFTTEFRVIWPDGSVHYLTGRGKGLYDESGKAVRMTGVILDVTERKEAEEIRSFMAAIVDSTDDAVIGKDMQGRIVSWNTGAERMFGCTAAEMLGQPVERILSPERPDEEPRILQQVKQGQMCHYETLRLRKDRHPIEVSLTVSPVKNARGQIVGISSIARDITQRNRAQAVLEQQAAVLREQTQMLDLANVLERDLDDRIILWNTGMEKMYGWSKKEALGKPAHELLRTEFPQPPDTIRAALFNQGGWEGDLTYFSKSGHRLVVASQWVLHTDTHGRPTAILEFHNDITERKRAQEKMLRFNGDLEERVTARTAELTAANRELEAFTYSVAHDLRAPLRHIDAFTKILHEDFAPLLPEQAQRYLDNIRNGSRNMNRLVDDLLNLAHVGRQELQCQPIDLSLLVTQVLVDLQRETEGRAIEWRIHQLPTARCDAGLMRQVFANLLDNAVKYTRPCKLAIVEVGTIDNNGDQTVFVRDNGVGFNMKYSDKLFGVFQRLHRSEDFEGTGVGLATVERIVRRHGGTVWAEASVGEGATFYFTIGAKDKNHH